MEGLTHKQKERRGRNPFNEAEITVLLAATDLGSFWHSAIAISRYTGLRIGDVAQLEWDTLSIPGKITVWTEKKDKRVSLDIGPVLKKALNAIPKTTGDRMFPIQAAVAADPIRRPNLSTYFRRVCLECGIVGKTFHDIRAFYISDCEAKGIPMPHISKAVGHSSTRTTIGYLAGEQKGKYE